MSTNFPPPFYRWRPHPWHGLEPGVDPPRYVQAYIEITPYDLVKYELSKTTGYLRVDRPQRSSSLPPTLYGFVPRTYCGKRVAALADGAEHGDKDPLDICVITERPISRADILLHTKVVGGIQAIDGGEADDKIIAVLENDNVYGPVNDVSDLPEITIERLRHYFSTYKMVPGEDSSMQIKKVYGWEHAKAVVEASLADYDDEYGN
jgi:inorganic pyrophosphatase